MRKNDVLKVKSDTPPPCFPAQTDVSGVLVPAREEERFLVSAFLLAKQVLVLTENMFIRRGKSFNFDFNVTNFI